jgi:hypothetical protein
MAHRKHRKRGRVRGPKLNASHPLLKVGALVGGYLLGDTINAQIDKMMPAPAAAATTTTTTPVTTSSFSLTSALPMVAELGLGGYLLLKKRGMLPTVVGGLLAGAGIRRALKSTGMIKGYQAVPVIAGKHRMAGYQSVPVIAGIPSQLQGIPGQLEGVNGYRVNGYTPAGSGVKVMF